MISIRKLNSLILQNNLIQNPTENQKSFESTDSQQMLPRSCYRVDISKWHDRSQIFVLLLPPPDPFSGIHFGLPDVADATVLENIKLYITRRMELISIICCLLDTYYILTIPISCKSSIIKSSSNLVLISNIRWNVVLSLIRKEQIHILSKQNKEQEGKAREIITHNDEQQIHKIEDVKTLDEQNLTEQTKTATKLIHENFKFGFLTCHS
jgi:hypothetical protein